MQGHSVLTYTLDSWGGVKRLKRYSSEYGHVVYQTKRREV